MYKFVGPERTFKQKNVRKKVNVIEKKNGLLLLLLLLLTYNVVLDSALNVSSSNLLISLLISLSLSAMCRNVFNNIMMVLFLCFISPMTAFLCRFGYTSFLPSPTTLSRFLSF